MKKAALALLTFMVTITASAEYTSVQGKFENSEIYPGTVHTYVLTIPEGIVSGGLFVGLDGVLCNAPAVIDTLTATGVMPPTFGVYLQPGRIVDADGNVLRYNRSNEFDATDGRFASFLETELLPYIEREHNIKFSENPGDRMIFGLSSGGIAAFNAAWHRPDLFSKVFAACGTFVPMRGGHNIQAIVRKHEPKPLRIFLQDGYQDTWNPIFGSWFEANYVLGTALEFAGYDCKFDWGEGVHSIKRANEIFKDVMLWMWRDYPAEIKAGKTKNNFLEPTLIDGEDWTLLSEQPDRHSELDSEAPSLRAIYPDGKHMAEAEEGTNFLTQYLLDEQGNKLYGQRFYWLHSYDNSVLHISDMEFDGAGYLWVITNAGLQICDQNGRVRGILHLPKDCGPEARLEILDGQVKIITPSATFVRRLNVTAPQQGVTPKSQGQA